MYKPRTYEVTEAQLLAIDAMSDERTAEVSSILASAYDVSLAYYPNHGGQLQDPILSTVDTRRIAYELNARFVDEPKITEEYVFGPTCLRAAGKLAIRGIALWLPRPDRQTAFRAHTPGLKADFLWK